MIFLPFLKSDKSTLYNELCLYPSDVNNNCNLIFEKLINGLIYQKNTNFSVNDRHKFDSLSNDLYYMDEFKHGLNQKLIFNLFTGDTEVRISCFDLISWMTSVD